MFKNLFIILFFFLFVGTVYAYSQSRDSATIVLDTVKAVGSSVATSVDSSVGSADASSTVEINEDSLYRPVADSAYLKSYTLRLVSQSKLDKYLADPNYEYANDPEYWKEDKVQDKSSRSWNIFNNKIVQWLVFLGFAGIILFGMNQLAKENNFRWFERKRNRWDSNDESSDRSETENFEEAIRKYQMEGNYRMTIRYMYLRLIRTASEKNIIQIRDSATNSEITRAFGSTPQAGEFRFLATAYEYIFYGDFTPEQEIFESLKTRFDSFQQMLSI